MISRNQPAFPRVESGGHDEVAYNGLTKREYFAGLAMQGYISNSHNGAPRGFEDVAERSRKFADALLLELQK